MKLSEIPSVVLVLVFTAVIIVAGFLVVDGVTDETACPSGYSLNASTGLCQTSNVSVTVGATYAGNASFKMQSGIDNITDYASTWGTIIGVAVLLGVVIGGFSMGRNKGWF